MSTAALPGDSTTACQRRRHQEGHGQQQADGTGLYEEFQRSQWNYYRFPDDMDRPSPLFDQLTWLSKAGFHGVDCFRLIGGHAIFGGYKSPDAVTGGIPYQQALQIANDILRN